MEIDAIVELKKQYIACAKEHGPLAIKNMLVEFLALNKELSAIRWRQHVFQPHEGDQLGFTVEDIEYQLASAGDDKWCYLYDSLALPNENERDVLRKLEELNFRLIALEEILWIAFGDDVMITCTNNGIVFEKT